MITKEKLRVLQTTDDEELICIIFWQAIKDCSDYLLGERVEEAINKRSGPIRLRSVIEIITHSYDNETSTIIHNPMPRWLERAIRKMKNKYPEHMI